MDEIIELKEALNELLEFRRLDRIYAKEQGCVIPVRRENINRLEEIYRLANKEFQNDKE